MVKVLWDLTSGDSTWEIEEEIRANGEWDAKETLYSILLG